MTLVTCDPDTGLRRGPVRFPDGNPPPPFGCRKCGMEAGHHYADVHRWERPTDAQILARMKARRVARAKEKRMARIYVAFCAAAGLFDRPERKKSAR
ncbi:hypothetical protein ACFVXE_08155 [Streptomyces sp. NPDC058231]|uniref:hypothetical protein n=1 Tax=Streptomyces sp. NPDC058231 TaxID=3346392 RepID=UPI0036E1A629